MSAQIRLLAVADAHVAASGSRQGWHNEFALDGSESRFSEVLASGEARQADAALVLGDVLNNPKEKMVPSALAEPNGLPLKFVRGNEDPPGLVDAIHPAARVSVEGQMLGSWLRLAGLDAESPDGGASGRAAQAPTTSDWGQDTVALLSHFPLLPRSADFKAAGLLYAGDLLDRSSWAEALLARSAPTVVLSGHLHARDSATAGRVLQLGFGALVEPPHEYSMVELEPGNGYPRIRRRTLDLGGPVPARDPSLAPRFEEWAFDGDYWQRADG